MSRNYNLQYFLQNNLVFTNLVQYNFEPMDNDQVTCKFDNLVKLNLDEITVKLLILFHLLSTKLVSLLL